MVAVEILENLFCVGRGGLSGNHFVYRAATPVLIDTAHPSEIPGTLGMLEVPGWDWRRTGPRMRSGDAWGSCLRGSACGSRLSQNGYSTTLVPAKDEGAEN
jgi:hypothetical protein